MMIFRLFAGILLATSLPETVSLAATAKDTTLTPELQKYAKEFRGTLLEMIRSDPALLRESGLERGRSLDAARLDFSHSFPLYRVDPARTETAQELAQAVAPTGLQYIPLCVENRCPLVAAFTVDENSGKPAFVSVGQPRLTERIQQAEQRLAAEPELERGRDAKVVEFPAAHANFHLAHREDGSDVLVPHSAREGESLLRLLDNPAEVRAAVTKRQRLLGFTVENLREVTARLRELTPPGSEQLPPGVEASAGPPPTKPFNGAVAHGPQSPGASQGGAVLDIPTMPSAMRRLRTAPRRVYEWAKTPTNPEQKIETASTEGPALGILFLLGAVFASVGVAWVSRKIKTS